MASSKEMMRRAKEQRQSEKNKTDSAKVELIKLYKKEDLIKNMSPIMTLTPEGIQEYADKIVNIVVYAPNSQKPAATFMTGYGASYLAKVMSGTPRATECQINVELLGKPDGWQAQVYFTSVGKLTQEVMKKLAYQALASLPKYKGFNEKIRKVAVFGGNSATQIGWV